MQLARIGASPWGVAPGRRALAPCGARRARVAARSAGSDDKAKVVREFREDSGEVVVPGAEPAKNAPLYADQVAPAAARKKDNLSREMKQRLRQEYYGLGGAENQASSPRAGRGMMVVAAARLVPKEDASARASPVATAAASGAAAAAPLAAGGLPRGSKWTIDPRENLRSTWEHRAWTYGCMALLGVGAAGAAADVHSAGDAAAAAGAVLAAYVLADLGTAVYHWGVDNYGDGDTPVVGRQIAAFQGHHQRPWTITQREFCNNVHQVFKPAAAPAAAIAAAGPWLPLGAHAFLPSFIFLVCMSQQFHAWSHMKKSELHPAVVALQDWGVLIGRKAHGAHHKPNFDANYSIVSGMFNPLLDGAGFFRALERLVHSATGVEPRCWYPPEHSWAEQAQPEP